MHLNLDFITFKKLTGSAGDIFPADFLFEKIRSLGSAGPHDLAFFIERGDAAVFDDIPRDKILTTQAACVVASYDIVPGKTCIVSDPLEVFHVLVDYIAQRDSKKFFIDERFPHAHVSRDAHLGEGVFVGPGVVVMPGAKIGAGTHLGAQSYIGIDAGIGSKVFLHPGAKVLDRCIVGDESILHAGAVIGSDGFGYQVTSCGLRKIPQIGIVRLGKHVEIGANATLDRAAFDETIIEDYVKIDNLVSIAHNAFVGRGSAILAQTCIAGSTKVGAGTLIGAQVAIRDNIDIGNRVKIVSKSGIMTNIEDGKIVAGIPAVSFTDWKRLQVIFRQLPMLVKKVQKAEEKKGLFLRGVVMKIKNLITR